jgi:hypothetical protein
MMTPREKMDAVKTAWERQIFDVHPDRHDAIKIVALAEMNGLFDLHKSIFAAQENAARVMDGETGSGSEK